MKKKLWSISAIAAETGKNPRTISKALANVPPDGQIGGHAGFFLSTGISALRQHEMLTGHVRGRTVLPYYDVELEAKIAAIESTGAGCDQLLQKLRAEPSISKRRSMVEAGGKVVGAFQRSLAASVGDPDSAIAPLRKTYIDSMLAGLMGEICSLCEWHLVEAREA